MYRKVVVIPIEEEDSYKSNKLTNFCKIAVALAQNGGLDSKGNLLDSKGKAVCEAFIAIQNAVGLSANSKFASDLIHHLKCSNLEGLVLNNKIKVVKVKKTKWTKY